MPMPRIVTTKALAVGSRRAIRAARGPTGRLIQRPAWTKASPMLVSVAARPRLNATTSSIP